MISVNQGDACHTGISWYLHVSNSDLLVKSARIHSSVFLTPRYFLKELNRHMLLYFVNSIVLYLGLDIKTKWTSWVLQMEYELLWIKLKIHTQWFQDPFIRKVTLYIFTCIKTSFILLNDNKQVQDKWRLLWSSVLWMEMLYLFILYHYI